MPTADVEMLVSMESAFTNVKALGIATMASIVSVEFATMVAFRILIVAAAMLVSMVNAPILAKVLSIVENMPFAKPQVTNQSAYAQEDTIGHQLALVVSKLAANPTMIVLQTNGATMANVKTPVLIPRLVESMLNAVLATIKLSALAQSDMLAIPGPNVFLMSMSVPPTLVGPMQDVWTWLAHLNANVSLDALAIPGLLAAPAQSLKLMDAESSHVDPMPNASLKMELENATVLPASPMGILTRAAQQDLEVRKLTCYMLLNFQQHLSTFTAIHH